MPLTSLIHKLLQVWKIKVNIVIILISWFSFAIQFASLDFTFVDFRVKPLGSLSPLLQVSQRFACFVLFLYKQNHVNEKICLQFVLHAFISKSVSKTT